MWAKNRLGFVVAAMPLILCACYRSTSNAPVKTEQEFYQERLAELEGKRKAEKEFEKRHAEEIAESTRRANKMLSQFPGLMDRQQKELDAAKSPEEREAILNKYQNEIAKATKP